MSFLGDPNLIVKMEMSCIKVDLSLYLSDERRAEHYIEFVHFIFRHWLASTSHPFLSFLPM